jgi:spermidine synthase
MTITFWKINTAAVGDKIDVDTQYNRVLIFNDKDFTTDRMVRRMNLGNQYASEMFLDSDELAFQYTNYYNIAPVFNPDIKKSLVIGGAAYSYPRDYLVRYPNATVDVVEIDPGLTDLAKKYFRLKDDSRMRIYHEDGRTFLNKTQERYDVIFVDAFNTETSVPFHLTTKEAVSKMHSVLNENGIVVINLISALDGPKGGFLNSEYHTYLSVFPKVYIFTVGTRDPEIMQNLVLVATKTDSPVSLTSTDPVISEYLGNVWVDPIKSNGIILTDDFSPVERFYKM